MKKNKNLNSNFLEVNDNRDTNFDKDDDFESEFNYAIVISGKIKQLKDVKQCIENKGTIIIRYQTLDKRYLKIIPEEVW